MGTITYRTIYLFFIFILIVLAVYLIQHESNKLSLVVYSIQIVGTFLATSFGVFLTFRIQNEIDKKHEMHAVISNIKLLYIEINKNREIMNALCTGLASIPNGNGTKDVANVLIKHSENISNAVFLSLVDSGDIKFIAKQEDAYLFNLIQQNYSIVEELLAKLRTAPVIYPNESEQQYLDSMLREISNQANKLLKMFNTNTNCIKDYLEKNNVTFVITELSKEG